MARTLLGLADNGVWRRMVAGSTLAADLASRYVAGTDADSLVKVLDHLAVRGLRFAVTRLAEPPVDADQLESTVIAYEQLLATIGVAQLAPVTELLVPLSGVQRNPGEIDAVRRICQAASNAGTAIMIEPAGATGTDAALEAVAELRRDFPQTGVELKSFYRRTERDCLALAGTDTRVRLSGSANNQDAMGGRGWRHEPGTASDLAYVRCMRVLLEGEGYPMLATHDSRFIAIAQVLAERNGRSLESFEFQMLYGVRPWEQQRLVDIGHRVRVVVPFGEDWWPFFVRSVAEEPSKVWSYLRSYVGRS